MDASQNIASPLQGACPQVGLRKQGSCFVPKVRRGTKVGRLKPASRRPSSDRFGLGISLLNVCPQKLLDHLFNAHNHNVASMAPESHTNLNFVQCCAHSVDWQNHYAS